MYVCPYIYHLSLGIEYAVSIFLRVEIDLGCSLVDFKIICAREP